MSPSAEQKLGVCSAAANLLLAVNGKMLTSVGGTVLNVNSIVVYTDLSPASADALRAAYAVARATQASVEVLRVIAEPLQADWTSEMSAAGIPAVQDAIEAEAREWLESVLGEADGAGVDLAVETGNPAAEIARHVEKERPDLLVIGAPANADEARDVAQQLVASAACSVLIVRNSIGGQVRRPA